MTAKEFKRKNGLYNTIKCGDEVAEMETEKILDDYCTQHLHDLEKKIRETKVKNPDDKFDLGFNLALTEILQLIAKA